MRHGAVGRDQRQRVGGGEVVGRHEVRDRRLLRRGPQQREALEHAARRTPGRRTVSTNGRQTSTAARPMSQLTITCLRSNRSTITPGGRRRGRSPGRCGPTSPGRRRPPASPRRCRAASAAMAKKPSQSPMDRATCVSQRWKNCDDCRTCRTCRPGLSPGLPTAGDGSVGASAARSSRPGSGTWRCSAIGSTLRVGVADRPRLRTLTAGRRVLAAFFAGAFAAFFGRPSSRRFLAGAFLAPLRAFLAGPASRRICSSSAARSMVMFSTVSPLRRLALVSPSVTYGPKRPSFTTTGFSDTGSLPSSLQRRGRRGLAAAELLRLGEDLHRLVEGDGEQLLLGVEAAGLVAPLEERAVAAVGGDDLARRRRGGRRRCAGAAGACSASSSVMRRERHRLEQRRHLRLRVRRQRVGVAELHVGTEAAALGEHRQARVRDRRRAARRPWAPTRISTARSMVSSSSGRSSGTDAVSSPRLRYGP